MKDYIVNLNIKDFIHLSQEERDEYMTVLQYVKRPLKRSVASLKLKHVEGLKQAVQRNNTEYLVKIISKLQKIPKESVFDLEIVSFYGYFNTILNELEQISNAEINGLTPKHTNIKWELVDGSNRMAKFGIYNTLDKLSEGDITKYKDIMNMPYREIFTILLMRKEQDDISHEMAKIKKQ